MRIPGTDKFVGVLGYLPVLGLVIARWFKRDSLFVQFHARQGAVLFGLWMALFVACVIALFFIEANGTAAAAVFAVLYVGTAIYALFMLIGIFKVVLGERYRMPVVADVALKMGL